MKKLLFALCLICAVTASCSKSLENEAKDLIKDDLYKSLHDYDSYKPVEFSKLDSTFTDISSIKGYDKTSEKLEKIKAQMKKLEHSIEFDADWSRKVGYTSDVNRQKMLADFEEYKELSSEADKLRVKLIKALDEFTPKFIGYSMIHKYRAKNKAGNTALGVTKYTFDKEITKIANKQSAE